MGRQRIPLKEERGLARPARLRLHHPPQEAEGPIDKRGTSRANGRRSKIRAVVEHVFAHQKARMILFVRTIGIGRAKMKIGMVNRNRYERPVLLRPLVI